MNPLWPHQSRGIRQTLDAIRAGHRRILLTSPTGMGKSRIMSELADEAIRDGAAVSLYTNRRLLLTQTVSVLEGQGHSVGVRAAGHGRRDELFQVSSMQTEYSRVVKRETWKLHPAARVLVDEAHLQKGQMATKLFELHEVEGAHAIIGITATPLDLGDVYDHLVIAGTTSEGRACGALLACTHYGCDEPDLAKIGKVPLGDDPSEKMQRQAIMVPGVFARVLEEFNRINPDHKPTILFGPDVAGSIWFAEQFLAAGISAAHIDGEECWINGEVHPTTDGIRRQILDASRDGTIKVLCNRFVLREGIDAPWLAHGIFACVFGSLQSYLQSGGRLLRSHPSLDSVTLQDHGGNWWRHGSLNADREWRLGLTAALAAGLREEMMRAKQTKEPARCPKCAMILNGINCPCGFQIDPSKKSRPVIQADGSLKHHAGDIFRPHRITQRPDAEREWEKTYYRAFNSGMTFRQAEALFASEHHWGYPPRTVPFMPLNVEDMFRRVADVPRDQLVPKGKGYAPAPPPAAQGELFPREEFGAYP
ncbi:MAG: DEAD/DEAH box helicase family protein [Gemmataceae bacterium]